MYCTLTLTVLYHCLVINESTAQFTHAVQLGSQPTNQRPAGYNSDLSETLKTLATPTSLPEYCIRNTVDTVNHFIFATIHYLHDNEFPIKGYPVRILVC